MKVDVCIQHTTDGIWRSTEMEKKNLNQEHIEIPVHMDFHLTVAQINISIKALCFSQPQLASNDHNYFYSIFAAGLRF